MINKISTFFLIGDRELPQVFYFYCLYFLIGAGMALGRGTADALFFKRYGIEYLPLMYIIVSITLCISSILYASLADRIPAEKFFKYLFTTLIIIIFINWLLMTNTDSRFSYPLYFVIYEVASELLVIHAAHYFSQNFDTLQTKRLSPIIMSGSQIGVIFGGVFLASTSHILGVQNIILIWCFLLVICLAIIRVRHKKIGTSPYYKPSYISRNKIKQSVTEVKEGLHLLKESKLLRAMSFALFFMVITFYVMCYSVNRIYTDTFKTEESLTAFFGILTAANSVAALLIQIFITNKLIRKFGAKKINLIFPITSIFSYLALLVSFALPSAIIASFNKDAIMTALRNPVRNIFFTALPDNIQGRARATAIVVVMPIALSITGALIWLMQSLENSNYLIALGITAAITYLYFSRQTNKAYVAEMVLHLKKKLFIPETDKRIDIDTHDEKLYKELSDSLNQKNTLTIDLARYIHTFFPYDSSNLILKHINNTDTATKDQIIKLLSNNYTDQFHKYLISELSTTDNHLKSTILKVIFDSRRNEARPLINDCIENSNPRIQAAGIYGCMLYRDEETCVSMMKIWSSLIQSSSINSNLASLELIKNIEINNNEHKVLLNNYKLVIKKLLSSEKHKAIMLTLYNLKDWPEPLCEEISSLIYKMYSQTPPYIRLECIKLCQLLSKETQQSIIKDALEDNSSIVRDKAVEELLDSGSYTRSDLICWITKENRGSPRSQLSILKTLQNINVPKDIMKTIAVEKAKDAHLLTQAINLLNIDKKTNTIPSMELLNYTLLEKRNEVIDLALFAMHSLENPENIDVIRAGLKSNNPRHIANACEVLLNMNEKEVSDILIEIFENLNKKEATTHDSENPEFSTISEMLIWCSNRLDPWLKSCSHNARKLYIN